MMGEAMGVLARRHDEAELPSQNESSNLETELIEPEKHLSIQASAILLTKLTAKR